MKIVILITVIESLAIMLAILYFYYRRSESGIGEGRTLKSTSRPGNALGSIQPVKGGYKI